MGYMNLVLTFMLQGMHLSHCFTINISGETYIEPGVPYKVTCTVSDFRENRRTTYASTISNISTTECIILHSATGGCNFKTLLTSFSPCESSICSCDENGLSTHWTYYTSTDLAVMVSFRCASKNNKGSSTHSGLLTPTTPNGPGSNISFTPANESITKVLGQSLGPIICSAQCNPPCQFHWIKPDGTVVDGSNLTIPSLTKNEHGTLTCHAGNGYGNNTTKNLLLTVIYGPEYVTLSPSTMTYNVTEGDTISYINCTALCRPQCTFMWNGPNVPGDTTTNLYLQNINRNQKGTFNCTATNKVGSNMSSNVVVDIKYGPGSNMSFNPADESITKNMSGSLGPIICSAQCNPPCEFYWTKTDGFVVDGSNLEIESLSKDDHGTFTCHAGNGYDNNGTKNLNVTVNYVPEYVTLSPPTTTYTVTEGDTIPSINCTASCRPQCTFMWTGPNVPGDTTNDLYLQNINRNQTGTFYCNATNEVGSNMSSNVVVDIKYGPGSSLSFTPADELVTIVLGQSLGPINCSAECNSPCQFHWIKPDGTVVYGSNLEILSLTKNDHGTFTCHAGNGYGDNATKNLEVTVNYGPESATLSPPNTTYTVTEGDTIPSINCTVSCRPQCTFMWTGHNVPDGTTNDLYLQNITRNQNGTFYCTATNNVGNKMSSNVEVDVRYGPGSSVSFNPANQSITTILGHKLDPIACSAQCNPQCQFYWIKPNGTVVDGPTLEIPHLSKDDHGTFICHTGNGYGNNTTKSLSVTVNYRPESVTLFPPTTTYTVTEGDTIPSINCKASCRPQCTFMWTGPNVPDGTTDDLYLQNINRNQKGSFNCTATNEVGSKVSYVEVDVQYQATVENVDINTNNTVDENSTVKFSCELEGNPAPTVTWSLNGKILQTTEGSTTKSSFIVNSARCNNTGRYICTASNIIGNSTKLQMLYVTCHPRNAIILDTTIAIKEKNATLNITVPIISYPQPTLISWTSIQNGTTYLIDSKYKTTTYGVYQHVSQLIKDGLIESEYGTYSINVSNNIGPYFQHDFKIVAETIPDPPSNVSAVCDTSPFSTIISWRSEFDGGRAQTFHVWFKICCENVHEFVAYRDEKSDPGRDRYVSIEITSLQAATPYIFYVSSSNDYGSSNSTKVFCNTTTESTRTEHSSAAVGIAAGTSSAIVVVIVVIVIVIIRRRFASDDGLKDNVLYEPAGPDFGRKPKSSGDEYAVVKKKGNTFHTNDDGMIRETALHAEDKKKPKRDKKDNILYEPAGPDFGRTPQSNGDEYAVVKKKGNIFHANDNDTIQETGLYAEVKKEPRLGQRGQIDSNTRKANVKDGMNEYKHDDVYENMEDKVGNERSKCQPMGNRNKDGLQYADLMFNPSPSGARFIIHGQDDKTIYADVDTTQKIDPLPDSDVEDDQNNSKSNKTAE